MEEDEEEEVEVEKAMVEREMVTEHKEGKVSRSKRGQSYVRGGGLTGSLDPPQAVPSVPAPMELDDTTASATDTTTSIPTHLTVDEDTDGQ